VRTGARDHPESLAPPCCRLDDVAISKLLEVFAERVEELGIVVNDQDPDPLVCHWGVPRRGGRTVAVAVSFALSFTRVFGSTVSLTAGWRERHRPGRE